MEDKKERIKKINKNILKTIVIVMAIIFGTTGALVYSLRNNDRKVVVPKEIGGLNDRYLKINPSKEKILEENKLTDEEAKILALKIDKIINKEEGLNEKQILSEAGNLNTKVKRIQNNKEDIEETIVVTDKYRVTFNSKTKKFINYLNRRRDLKNSQEFTEEQVIEKGKEILNEIQAKRFVKDFEKYNVIRASKFNENLWNLRFIKKYEDGLANYGEAIAITICPKTKYLAIITVRDTKVTNTEVKITEEQAKEIASKYLKSSVATGIESIEKEIVSPNLLFKEKVDKVYKNINEMRRAYIVTFNNEAKTQIYVDVTTGEVLRWRFYFRR